jgi:HTH-type transcriptional regulator / antitoxin HigA
MATRKDNSYKPDYAVLPGDSLVEILESVSMTQKELASRMGRPLKTINEIVKGKTAITAETALQLERVLGTPASFWTNLEKNYREALARKADAQRLIQGLAWLKRFPIRAMQKAGWLSAGRGVELLQELLSFFGIASPDQWDALWGKARAAYRKSPAFAADAAAVAAWLRRGEQNAQGIACQPFDDGRFRQALQDARRLTSASPEVFLPDIQRLCAEAGVAVVFVRELPKTRVCGATRWLSPTKALIQLSLRYKSDDQLWFSFFHEAAHVLLHGKRDVFIEGDASSTDAKETEADAFAADILIPRSAFDRIRASHPFTDARMCELAVEIGIPPGIIVGRLQHDGLLRFNQLNHLKRRFEWAPPHPQAAA